MGGGIVKGKITAVLNTRNEDWIIERTIISLSSFVDEIIVIDGSSDDTPKILKRSPKVILYHKNEKYRSEVKDFNALIKMARERDADWILFIDGDEIFEAKMEKEIRDLINVDNVGVYYFKKLWLWRDENVYRADRTEKFSNYNENSVLARMTPKLRWEYPIDKFYKRVGAHILGIEKMWPQFGRGSLLGIEGKKEKSDIILYHYAAVDWSRIIKKQIRYACMETKTKPNADIDKIIARAYSIVDERGLMLKCIEQRTEE